MSEALYRKWRPQKFSELLGQNHIKTTLQNALTSNRVTHAYLFSGPRGSGKTTTARLLAKAVNCQDFKEKESEPCNQCDSCQEIQKGESLDLIEIDAASNRGIEEIKDLREKVKFIPSKSKYKVFVIDEVHMLTREAFNALLKTLEEPPRHVIFILATTEPHKVPQTILSRCQRFDFRRLADLDLMARLRFIAEKEGLKMEEEANRMIVKASFGSARDAESLLDLIISRGLSEIKREDIEEILGKTESERIEKMYDFLLEKDAPSAISLLNQVIEEGKDLFQFTSNLIEYLREKLIENPSQGLAFWIKIFCQAQREMKTAFFMQLPLELAIVEIAAPEEVISKNESVTSCREKVKVGEEIKKSQTGQKSLDWDKVVSEIKPQNHSLCFLLENCQPLDINNNQIILGVDFKFHKDKLEEDKNRKIIENVIKKVTGRDFKIICQVVKGIHKIKTLSNEDEKHESKDSQDLIKEVEEILNTD